MRWAACGLIASLCAASCTSPASPPAANAAASTAEVSIADLSTADVSTADVSTTAAATTPAAASASIASFPASGAPLPFEGLREVGAGALFDALAAELPALAAAPAVREDWRRLRLRHALPEDDALYADFVRVRLAFEATRAGGLWGLEWRVTDRQPRSDAVWTQWAAAGAVAADAPPAATVTTATATTAIAECDELSALFAVVAHGLGLSRRSRVGLLWPTANHTVAVWAFDAPDGHEVRVVAPTSQIFLDGVQGLDTDAFDPWAQKTIYDYVRRDAARARVPAALARRFVAEARHSGALSRGELQALRNRREYDQRRAASAGREH